MNFHLVPRLHSLSLLNRIVQVNSSIGSVRFKRREPKRKPIWLPKAPSKLFVIPEKVVYPKDEEEQLEHLHFFYQSELLSIRDYCRDNFYLPSKTAGGLSTEQVQDEEHEHMRLLKENEEENGRVAKLRQERLVKEQKILESDLLKAEEERSQFLKSLHSESEMRLEAEINRSRTYITIDSLDKCIEEALAHPVHYDFAITKDGALVTDGKIHVNALVPTAIPNTSSVSDQGMIEPGTIRLKPRRLFFDPLEIEKEFV